MIVRRAVPSDETALTAMMEAFENYLHDIDPAEHTLRPIEALARVAALLVGPEPAFTALIAEKDGVVAGYASVQTILWMDDAAPAVWLSELFVAATFRGQGVGSTLLEAVRAHAREIGGRRIVWTVWDRNAPAMAFYGRQGGEAVAGEMLMTLRTGGGGSPGIVQDGRATAISRFTDN